MKIGVIDSGVGGLSVLKELVKALPQAEFIYFADSANCPYGTKDPQFIKDRTARIVSDLISVHSVRAVVVACNTATAAAIAHLRATFPIPFVGMEPALKPAATGTASGVVGVLATAGTLSASRYLDMRDKYAGGVKVVEHVGEGFVELVERGELDSERARSTVEKSLRPLLEAGADTIVLGCTHYPFLLGAMQQIAGPGVRFIDPAPSVARQLLRVLDQQEGAEVPARAGKPGCAEKHVRAGQPEGAKSAKGAESRGKEAATGTEAGDGNVTLISSGEGRALEEMWKRITQNGIR